MKFILGISAFYHDSSVCLFKDNELVFACEEEKFTGIKHDDSFPHNALAYVYKHFGVTLQNLEVVCYYEDPQLKYQRVVRNIKARIFTHPIYSTKSFLKIKRNMRDVNRRLSALSPNVYYSTHHESHLYYSYYTSDFEGATCVSVDGVGEIDTVALGIAETNGIKYTTLARYPHSLGLYYSAMTSYLGFKPNEGEYKVMGLASYGDPKKYIDQIRKLISYEDGRLVCNMEVFCWNTTDKIMFNEKLAQLLIAQQRLPEEALLQEHKDLAASVQLRYEEILFEIVKHISKVSSSRNLCLSGGCAYNGTANGKIVGGTDFVRLWIPPAPSDAGSAVGAVVHYLVKKKTVKNRISNNPFLGPAYSLAEIEQVLAGSTYKTFSSDQELRQYVAKELNDGKVVGWFSGAIEFGARALGNRSILANPTLDGMKDKINRVIKKREGFRPFAPMVTKEKQDQYFEMTDDVPYMNQVVKVRAQYKDILKAVTHVDGTARVQTVYTHNPIHKLLTECEKVSGYPILLNTSFNIKDKTMVLTPKDALDTFYDTEMDLLVMGNYVVYKS